MTKLVRLALSLAIISTLMIIPALPGSAQEPPVVEFPACPLVGDIVLENGVDWGPEYMRADANIQQARYGPVAIDLLGEYDIALATFDTHTPTGDPDDLQDREQWFIEVFDGEESTFVSAPIADLPADETLIVEQVASRVRLVGDSITVNHAAFADNPDNADSFYALCAAFTRVGFIDDDDSIFESDIEWMFANGYTKGCNPPANDRYCPDDFVTRGQMAAFLARALGLTEQADNPFTDDDSSIFQNDIEKLAASGITKGCNPPANDRYCPDELVTREQMAAFLTRALGLTAQADDPFTDDDDSIFEADIEKLAAEGITKGCNPPVNDRYCPDDFVTRGQMAAFLRRGLS